MAAIAIPPVATHGAGQPPPATAPSPMNTKSLSVWPVALPVSQQSPDQRIHHDPAAALNPVTKTARPVTFSPTYSQQTPELCISVTPLTSTVAKRFPSHGARKMHAVDLFSGDSGVSSQGLASGLCHVAVSSRVIWRGESWYRELKMQNRLSPEIVPSSSPGSNIRNDSSVRNEEVAMMRKGVLPSFRPGKSVVKLAPSRLPNNNARRSKDPRGGGDAFQLDLHGVMF